MMNDISLSPDFINQVTTACRHYEKVERLGDLPIAGPALRAALSRNPDHPTGVEGRGRALQRAIQAGLEQLALPWALIQTDALDLANQKAQRASMALENAWGIIVRHRGDLKGALLHLDRAIALAQAQDAVLQLTRARNNRASVYREQARYDDAIHDYEQNLPLIEETGEAIAKAITLLNLGIAHTLNNAPVQAIPAQMEALALFKKLKDALGCYLAHTNLAEAHFYAKDLLMALQHAQADIQSNVAASHQAERQRIYAEILLAADDCEAARSAIARAWSLLHPDGPDSAPLDVSKAEWARKTM